MNLDGDAILADITRLGEKVGDTQVDVDEILGELEVLRQSLVGGLRRLELAVLALADDPHNPITAAERARAFLGQLSRRA